ncbi:MAG: hypothetical protein JWM45_182 [Pseudonocardiales bacterium]|nr:hypothetical protein [Pseudonocardiales bacterium]
MTQKSWASPGSRECPPGINIQLTNAMTMSAKVGEVLKSKFLRKRKHLCGIPVVSATSRRTSQTLSGSPVIPMQLAEADT